MESQTKISVLTKFTFLVAVFQFFTTMFKLLVIIFVFMPSFCLYAFVSVDPRAERFIIGSNDHGRTQNYDFSVLDRKYPFFGNLLQKIKVESLS